MKITAGQTLRDVIAKALLLVAIPVSAAEPALPPATQPAEVAAAAPTSAPATQPAAQTPVPAQPANPLASYVTIKGRDGFWRLARNNAGVWWFISPDNRPEFLNLVDTVQPVIHGRDRLGPDFVSTDYDEHAKNAMDRWAEASVSRVLNIGFKGIGAWSSPTLHNFNVPMTQDLNISSWARSSNALFFSPAWSKAAEDAVKEQTTPLKENHNLVGYYLDNEVDWDDEGGSPANYFDGLKADDPNRREILNVIRATWPNVHAFNGDWGSSLQDWDGLSRLQALPRAGGAGYERLAKAWLSHLAESYFKLTSDLVKKYDPNHLLLGVRYRGSAPLEVIRASRDYTDAQSLNYYVADARLDAQLFRSLSEESGQPIVISEYSFHALDNRSGDRNLIGFDAQVATQAARGEAYRQLTSRLARVPYVVGADWFQWADEPASGRASDGEDVNFGVVDVDDHPYEPLAAAVRSTGAQLDELHAGSGVDKLEDVWRESFENRPTAKVPFLSKPIKLDGRLNDWPAESRIPGIRQSMVVGADPHRLPPPEVYLGWTDQGLYLGFTVYDNDISAAPAAGWWWARDSVEFWVGTRPPRSDQRDYDVYDHHFFFVPVDYPTLNGVAGVVGQWHSPGDAVTDHLIPHPDIKQVTRLFTDHYTVEMFIPAASLHGFDPKHQSMMAFNFHARDYQHAAEYFWSAPKQVQTQAHPNTWGLIELQPAGAQQLPIANIAAELQVK